MQNSVLGVAYRQWAFFKDSDVRLKHRSDNLAQLNSSVPHSRVNSSLTVRWVLQI